MSKGARRGQTPKKARDAIPAGGVGRQPASAGHKGSARRGPSARRGGRSADEWESRHLPLHGLRPDPYALPLTPASVAEIPALTKLLKEGGSVAPPLVRQSDGGVIDGWERVEAAKQAGREGIDCTLLDDHSADIVLGLSRLGLDDVGEAASAVGGEALSTTEPCPGTPDPGLSAIQAPATPPGSVSPDVPAPGTPPSSPPSVDSDGRRDSFEIVLRSPDHLHEHPRTAIIPEASADEYAQMRDDIRVRGIESPLRILEDGTVLDGRHRRRIAAELGLSTVPCLIVHLGPDEDPVAWMVRAALLQRHLTVGQKIAIVLELDDYREQKTYAAARRRSTQFGSRDGSETTPDAARATLPEPAASRPRDLVAKVAGASARTVQDVHTVWCKSAELFTEIKLGRIQPHTALRRLKAAEAAKAKSDGPSNDDPRNDGVVAAESAPFNILFDVGDQLKAVTKQAAKAFDAGCSASTLSRIAPRLAKLRSTLGLASALAKRIEVSCGPMTPRPRRDSRPRRRKISTKPDRPRASTAPSAEPQPSAESVRDEDAAAGDSADGPPAEGEGGP